MCSISQPRFFLCDIVRLRRVVDLHEHTGSFILNLSTSLRSVASNSMRIAEVDRSKPLQAVEIRAVHVGIHSAIDTDDELELASNELVRAEVFDVTSVQRLIELARSFSNPNVSRVS